MDSDFMIAAAKCYRRMNLREKYKVLFEAIELKNKAGYHRDYGYFLVQIN